ncbi:hypothetical protein SCOR_32935 [Sulfidibacter corallicola]|uniref:Uncharacterized protein n=1 Tax=Sulfidibacter corallicola TaxID=2818388 RepID=A0A8A4TJ77_SULCO|nr:hypothetical protein [Sulfidibacter corallicola]QTD49653.1 hypothetical protein J3U87_29065 [Sulfidibacter corallicola]
MRVADLIVDLQVDLADPDHGLFTQAASERFVSKAVLFVGRDLDSTFQIDAGAITPEPDADTRELFLILAQIHACQFMRARTATVIDVSSGDKSVDRSRTPVEWANLEKDLRTHYQQRLAAARPTPSSPGDDCGLITPNLATVIYEQGRDL